MNIKSKSFKLILTAGIAMFSIFFGSGNLVFPIKIGATSLDSFPIATLGLLLTGIIVPLLGLVGMNLYSGSRRKFFATLGPKTAFIVTAAMLLLLGPFGVGPRCVLVAFGGVQLVFPNFSFPIFSILFCSLIGFFCWNKASIIEVISKYLTPWLIISLLTIILAAFLKDGSPAISDKTDFENFLIGVNEGYQTMDLLASFFFSSAIFKFIKNHSTTDEMSNRRIFKIAILSSFLGAFLLAIFYFALVYCGAKFSYILTETNPEQYISVIAGHVLGKHAKIVVSITIAFACLTTIIILTALFADFLSHDICKKKLGITFSRRKSLIVTLIATFLVSLSGFKVLSFYIAKALSIFYPALIMFVLAAIAHKSLKINIIKPIFWTTSLACIFFNT